MFSSTVFECMYTKFATMQWWPCSDIVMSPNSTQMPTLVTKLFGLHFHYYVISTLLLFFCFYFYLGGGGVKLFTKSILCNIYNWK